MQSFCDDGKVDYKPHGVDRWETTTSPCWNFKANDYRKHDPYREFREAEEDGKVVQFMVPSGKWRDGKNLNYDQPPENYRVKQEPRRFWVIGSHSFNSKQGAIEWHRVNTQGNPEIIEVMEVEG